MRFLILIATTIQNSSVVTRVVLLVFAGLLMAEMVLRSLGLYNPVLSQDFSAIKSALTGEQFNNRFTANPPIDFSNLTEYSYNHRVVPDNDYGLGLHRLTSRDIFKSHGKLIWDVAYHIEDPGRRVTPSAKKIRAPHFFVFYGGSRTFGQGVEDHETLPSRFQELTPLFKVYNYGVPALAMNSFLKKHENGDFARDIPEQKGVFIYVFDSGHHRRVMGAIEVPWIYRTSYYEFDEGHQLTYRGTFWKNRFLKTFLFYLGSRTALVQNLVMVPLENDRSVNESEVALTVRFFEKMKEEAGKMNGSLFFPVFFDSFSLSEPIWTAAQKAGLEPMVFKQPPLPSVSPETYFEYDGHPRPPVYLIQARLIHAELKKRKLIPGR